MRVVPEQRDKYLRDSTSQEILKAASPQLLPRPAAFPALGLLGQFTLRPSRLDGTHLTPLLLHRELIEFCSSSTLLTNRGC